MKTKYARNFVTGFALVLFAVSYTLAGSQQGRRQKSRPDNAPERGEVAPTFTISSLDGKSTSNLDSLRAQGPVVLFFGSYT